MNQLAAPICRYSDPRLYGTALTQPFNASYEWIRTVANPIHPKCNLIAECAVRAMKVFTGAIALVLLALPALIGRLVQVIHYHSLSEEERQKPVEIEMNGMRLPNLQRNARLPAHLFHGTGEAAAINILRWGFDPSKTERHAKMAEAVYISAGDHVSAVYGKDQLILSLDVMEEEIAYLDNHTLAGWKADKDFSDKETMNAIRELFYQNGYRAIRYDLDLEDYGGEVALAVYDPSCISIIGLKLSGVAHAAIVH